MNRSRKVMLVSFLIVLGLGVVSAISIAVFRLKGVSLPGLAEKPAQPGLEERGVVSEDAKRVRELMGTVPSSVEKELPPTLRFEKGKEPSAVQSQILEYLEEEKVKQDDYIVKQLGFLEELRDVPGFINLRRHKFPSGGEWDSYYEDLHKVAWNRVQKTGQADRFLEAVRNSKKDKDSESRMRQTVHMQLNEIRQKRLEFMKTYDLPKANPQLEKSDPAVVRFYLDLFNAQMLTLAMGEVLMRHAEGVLD